MKVSVGRYRYPSVQQGCCSGVSPCKVVEIGDGISASRYQVCCYWALETKKTCDCPRHWEHQGLNPIQTEEVSRLR